VLPVGVVCDSCNNYFAREVEKPFLGHPSISLLRFHQKLVSKKGRIPTATGILMPRGTPVVLEPKPKPEKSSMSIDPDVAKQMVPSAENMILLPVSLPRPTGTLLSRFLAKTALEFMATRLAAYAEGIAYIVDEVQLDQIRNHARYGKIPAWPIHSRRIYDANACFIRCNEFVQVIHESDILVTQNSEWYYVLALFGEEYAINMGGPEVDGYVRWLQENDNISPLYHGKNIE
jgi:hypothetical protein